MPIASLIPSRLIKTDKSRAQSLLLYCRQSKSRTGEQRETHNTSIPLNQKQAQGERDQELTLTRGPTKAPRQNGSLREKIVYNTNANASRASGRVNVRPGIRDSGLRLPHQHNPIRRSSQIVQPKITPLTTLLYLSIRFIRLLLIYPLGLFVSSELSEGRGQGTRSEADENRPTADDRSSISEII